MSVNVGVTCPLNTPETCGRKDAMVSPIITP